MTSATDELRRLLDERGVEWTFDIGEVHWRSDGHWFRAWQGLNNGSMVVSSGYYTPEQAVEATLGRGTCRIVPKLREYVLGDGTKLYEDGCSECGGYLGDDDNYCPNCGREVVI